MDSTSAKKRSWGWVMGRFSAEGLKSRAVKFSNSRPVSVLVCTGMSMELCSVELGQFSEERSVPMFVLQGLEDAYPCLTWQHCEVWRPAGTMFL